MTEYSILVKRLALDMNVRLAYKSHGDFHQYRLTKHNYVGKAVEVSGVCVRGDLASPSMALMLVCPFLVFLGPLGR